MTTTETQDIVERLRHSANVLGNYDSEWTPDVATMRAAAAEIERLRSLTEWRPIETAPRDGTCVLLSWAQNAHVKPIDWTRDPKTAGVFVQAASWWQGDGWVVYCSMIQDPSLHFDPTPWRHLPPPPEAK